MRRLKRNEEGVSPVIATILMVAITVVLAATLWMMLDTGDEAEQDIFVTTNIQERGTMEDPTDAGDTTVTYVQLGITSMDPSSADLEDVEVIMYDAGDSPLAELDGEENEDGDWDLDARNTDYRLRWTRVGDEVTDTARLWAEYDGDDGDFDGYEVVMTIDGYGGSAVWNL